MLTDDELDYVFRSAMEIYRTLGIPVSFETVLYTVAREYLKNKE